MFWLCVHTGGLQENYWAQATGFITRILQVLAMTVVTHVNKKKEIDLLPNWLFCSWPRVWHAHMQNVWHSGRTRGQKYRLSQRPIVPSDVHEITQKLKQFETLIFVLCPPFSQTPLMITVLVVFTCLSARNAIWRFLQFHANFSQIDLHNLQTLLFYYFIFRSPVVWNSRYVDITPENSEWIISEITVTVQHHTGHCNQLHLKLLAESLCP